MIAVFTEVKISKRLIKTLKFRCHFLKKYAKNLDANLKYSFWKFYLLQVHLERPSLRGRSYLKHTRHTEVRSEAIKETRENDLISWTFLSLVDYQVRPQPTPLGLSSFTIPSPPQLRHCIQRIQRFGDMKIYFQNKIIRFKREKYWRKIIKERKLTF